ncbi:MAG: hypothetical protein ACRDNZ_23490 [Streptosporangiaceae bacterium]
MPPEHPARTDPPDERPALPQRSRDETEAGWSEPPEPDDDERLRAERPPHHDR